MATSASLPQLNPRTRERLEKLDHHLCGDVLFISSATEVGKMYKVTRHGCMCKAFTFNLKCYHMDIYRYLTQQPQYTVSGPRTPEEIEIEGAQHDVVTLPARKRRYTEAEYEALAESLNQDLF